MPEVSLEECCTIENSAETPLPNEASESLLQDMSAVFQDSIRYAASRLSLAATEAKIAAISLVLMLVLFALVLLCSIWGLSCYALATWLTTSTTVSALEAVGIVIISNAILLILSVFGILRSAKSLTFEHTLQNPPSGSKELE